MTSIGDYAFEGCYSLTSIIVDKRNTTYDSRENCNAIIDTKSNTLILGCKNTIIPNSVTSIGEWAFRDCKRLTSITIPISVTSIGNEAFSGCWDLTSITIPNSVTSIGNYVFYDCTDLTSITIPNSVTSIGNYAFYNCRRLTSIMIPNSVTSIGNYVFYDCIRLTSITIPNSVTSIGDYAFYKCSGLTSITIPNSVTSIGNGAFGGCSGLTSIIVEQGNKKYDSRNNSNAIIETESNTLIAGCMNTVIPNSVTSIGNYVFYDCRRLTSITIPNSVTSIGNYVFYDCTGLTSITIPNSVTSIGEWAFRDCERLTSITIPNSVTSIEEYTFRNCSSITSITIPNSVTSIGNCAFKGCSRLTSITCEASTPPNCSYNYNSIFNPENKSIPVYVPANSVDAYKKANVWKDFTNIQEIPDNQKMADAVVAMINAIGKVEYTDACKDKIDEANNAYNALTADQKTLVTNLDILTKAQQTYETLKAAAEKLAADKTKADAVIAKITAIGKVEYTDACKGKIDAANTAYNTLTADQKALVTNLDVLTNAQQTYDNLKAAADKLAADKAKADPVIAKIAAIGKVEYTYACKDKIDEANNAYNALTNDQKALVTNVDVLTTAKQTYETLKAAAEKLAADKTKADAVIAKITAIGKVEYTYACKDKIDEANNAYNALTNDQKALVTNVDVLTTAKQTYDNLKAAAEKLAADKAKAEPVIAKINAIGNVEYTDACKSKIDEANNAYNALTTDQKALVTNLDVLTTAQQTYDNLRAAAEKLAADKAAFDQYKSEQKAIIEALVKEDDSDAVKKIIKKAISDIDAWGYEEAISLDDNKVNINSFVTSVNEAVEKQRAEDQKTNGIEELEFAEKVNIYDLNGRKITNSMLKSGLYIRNGKKVVVK